MPVSEQRKNPFKQKPGSLQCSANTSHVLEAANENNTRSVKKSNVFLRAARSITKTKSVSGNFIVKTMICKSNVKRQYPPENDEKETSVDNKGASVPMIPAKKNEISSPQVSPRASTGGKYFMSMQMTPNPLIKNSFASPVKEQALDRSANAIAGGNCDLQAYHEPSAASKVSKQQYATLSSNKKVLRARDASQHSGGANGNGQGMGSAIKAIPIQKIDISQFSNQMEHVPKIKGIKKQLLLQLYVAKCQDLVINTSKQQMLRFFDLLAKNHKVLGTRKLNLAEMALGDQAMHVICKIMKNNTKFAELDISKNCFTNAGLKQLARVL